MKIAILTLPFHINYGGILQAYALQTVLEKMGHKVDVVEFTTDSPGSFISILKRFKIEIIGIFKSLIKKYVLGRKVYIVLGREREKLIPITHQHTNRFILKYLHRVKYVSPHVLNASSYDAYIVGSDQIWRPMYCPNIYHAFLDFTENWKVKRIAYAPSFGSDEWEYTEKQTVRCKKLLKTFDAVSVREDYSVALCRDFLDCNAVQMLDPTLLLEKAEYESLINAIETPSLEGNLFNYILDETETSKWLVETLSADLKLKPFKVNVWEPYAKVEVPDIVPLEARIQKPLEQWLKSIKEASFVVTDSFHACVFSIIFGTPFAVVQNPIRGNGRIGSLLRLINEEFRLISSQDDFYESKTMILSIPDKDLLKIKRKECFAFLIESLK